MFGGARDFDVFEVFTCFRFSMFFRLFKLLSYPPHPLPAGGLAGWAAGWLAALPGDWPGCLPACLPACRRHRWAEHVMGPAMSAAGRGLCFEVFEFFEFFKFIHKHDKRCLDIS